MINNRTLNDYLNDLTNRISRLETGGRPISAISDLAWADIPLTAGADITGLAATLSWSNPNILVNPSGIPYISIYVDTDDDPAYLWPSGVSLSAGQKNLQFDWFMSLYDLQNDTNESRVRIYLKNNDSNSHTYYFYLRWLYVAGGSGSPT